MKNTLSALFGCLVLILPGTRAFAHDKPLPPAFGKEIVHDDSKGEPNEQIEEEIEEEQEERERLQHAHTHHELPLRGVHLPRVDDEGDDDDGGGAD